ncbi:chorismate-binding protein [Vibrio albus]|uniref:Chorismate-binding protein n=1 Tax=Vibrio albus TaxID=2200953 RepID=A0A2U3BB13_9VIBR|nr:chromate efflux transporter [Vibrio albus]PWI33986.1 chorismate-binding protein [Vibrio albus]
MLTIFKTFFALGWISFGGPAAHIGYFRNTFVEKLKWLTEEEYAQIVALSQFLPGPGSSQVGFAIGYKHAGVSGALAAFLGFTLPSIIIMLVLAALSASLTTEPLFLSAVHGLKLLAVVVVADAIWGMFSKFCQTTLPVGLCLFTAIALLVLPGIATQALVLIAAAMTGSLFLQKSGGDSHDNLPFRPHWLPLLIFALLLTGLPLLTSHGSLAGIFSDFFQAGSLVFGGGHVVLPLLQNIVGDQLPQDAFLTGYAAAQAIPGPMFTFATYIGYIMSPEFPVLGALFATAGVFLPGFLLLLGILRHWQRLASIPKVDGALNGVNAAVVGLLIAALYQPIFLSAVNVPLDFALVLSGLFLQKQLKLPLVWMVTLSILAGLLLF